MAPFLTQEILIPIIYLNFISGAAYLLTRDYIERNDKWADIPLIAISFTMLTAFLIAFPLSGEFVYGYQSASVTFIELGLFYWIVGIISFIYTIITFGYFLYLKLGWFDRYFTGKRS